MAIFVIDQLSLLMAIWFSYYSILYLKMLTQAVYLKDFHFLLRALVLEP